jgi:hypothetical protein
LARRSADNRIPLANAVCSDVPRIAVRHQTMPEIPAPSSSDRFSSGSASWKNMISLFIRLSKIDIHFFWLLSLEITAPAKVQLQR